MTIEVHIWQIAAFIILQPVCVQLVQAARLKLGL